MLRKYNLIEKGWKAYLRTFPMMIFVRELNATYPKRIGGRRIWCTLHQFCELNYHTTSTYKQLSGRILKKNSPAINYQQQSGSIRGKIYYCRLVRKSLWKPVHNKPCGKIFHNQLCKITLQNLSYRKTWWETF